MPLLHIDSALRLFSLFHAGNSRGHVANALLPMRHPARVTRRLLSYIECKIKKRSTLSSGLKGEMMTTICGANWINDGLIARFVIYLAAEASLRLKAAHGCLQVSL
jgi:hypothetical protein